MPNLVAQVKRAINDSDTAVVADLYDDKFCTPLETSNLLHFSDADNLIKDDCGGTWAEQCTSTVGPGNIAGKFGGSAGYFDGNVGLSRETLFYFYGQDFTVDFWCIIQQPTAYNNSSPRIFVFTNYFSTTYHISLYVIATNKIGVFFVINGVYYVVEVGGVSFNAWHHHAIVHTQNKWYYFMDGVLKVFRSYTFPTRYYAVQLGLNAGMQTVKEPNVSNNHTRFRGFISEFRLVDGKAIWTANFTPPTQPYKLVDGHIPVRLQGSTKRLWAPFNFIKTDTL